MIEFFIPGVPQGKARARSRIVTSKKTGKQFTSHYTPEKTRTYEKSISVWGREAMGFEKPFSVPIMLNLAINMPVPVSWPAWKRDLALQGLLYPTVKPDADNIEKAIKDGLNGIAWIDDCYVVQCSKNKSYAGLGEQAGVWVTVTPLNALCAQITKKSEADALQRF